MLTLGSVLTLEEFNIMEHHCTELMHTENITDAASKLVKIIGTIVGNMSPENIREICEDLDKEETLTLNASEYVHIKGICDELSRMPSPGLTESAKLVWGVCDTMLNKSVIRKDGDA